MPADVPEHPLLLTITSRVPVCMQDVFGYQEMFLVQAAACPPALQVSVVITVMVLS
jgi:hypothetical protein